MTIHRKSRYLPPCAFLLALAATGLHAQQLPETPEDVETAKAVEAERPKTPMELPPNPPTVVCQNGQLSITAENSTMGSVLALVHGCIGVAIDAPQGSSGTRMYAKLGPGPTSEILQSLLSSTDFDYVIEPSSTNPHAIQAVMIMARPKEGKDQNLAADRILTPQRRAWLEARHNARPYDEITDESHAVEAEPAPVVEPVVPATPPAPDANTPPPPGAAAASSDPAKTAAAATTDVAAVPAPATNDASAAPPPDSNGETSPAAKMVQEKINTMQQLFEQRKQQMMQNQAAQQPGAPQ